VIATLTPRTMRDLGRCLIARAEAVEADDSRLKANRSLTPEGVERLAEILLAGSSPTCGFFARYRGTES